MSVKAFELSSVIEKVTVGERIRIQIECIEYCGGSVYVGTYDSFVIEFKCENTRIGSQSQSQQFSLYKYLGLKKPVIILKAIFILERILCVCDSNLIILNQDDLEIISYGHKLKNVNTLCLNENPSNSNPFSVQLCIARKKQLLIYNLTSEKMIALKDISISEPALSLSMDGQYICVGTDSQFLIVNWETNHIQDLCASDCEISVPVSKRITKEEFLISGPSSLGLFVKTTGISEKPPLQWGTDILAIAYSHPYILCLSDRSLSIFSIVDQQLKQVIPFNGGTYLDNFDGNILISSTDCIYALRPVAWEKQVQMLLANKKVKEALDLSENWREAGLSKQNYNNYITKIKREAGFVELSERNLNQAKQLFIDGNLDILELLDLYPDLLPKSLKLNRPVQHYIDNIPILSRDKCEHLDEYQLFLLEYLEELITNKSEQYLSREMEINTALITLYSQLKPYSTNLLILLSANNLKFDIEWVVKSLELNNHYHCLALHYSQNKSTFDKAIDIWVKIETNVYSDELYPGLSCIANFLSSIDDEQIILNNIDFVLERDQKLGASVLINRKEEDTKLNADTITQHLQRYPEAEQIYLEYLVFRLKIEKEKFHTHLAVIYIENLVKLINSDGIESQIVKDLREKLKHLLKESSLYRVQLILGKVIEAKLHYECALLYGKLGEHERTLGIFVEQLQDYKLAEQYCVELYSGRNNLKERYQLFHTLLGIYLDLSHRNVTNLVTPALELLNNEVTQFDTIKVLQLIPQNWSISIIEQFLNKGIRRSLHRLRQSMVTKGLVTTENRIVKHEKIMTERKFLFLNEDRVCTVCRTSITEPEFMWFPTLQIVLHPHCGKGLAINSNKLS